MKKNPLAQPQNWRCLPFADRSRLRPAEDFWKNPQQSVLKELSTLLKAKIEEKP